MQSPVFLLSLLWLLPISPPVYSQATSSPQSNNLDEFLATKPAYKQTKNDLAALRSHNRSIVGIATHRAANEFAPENTLAAMKCALDLGADFIETDVRLTSDGASVILHDGSLNRTTNGTGPLKNLTFKEVRNLSAGKWFDPFFTGEKVPTLEEACRLLADHNRTNVHKTWFYVDCKDIDATCLVDVLKKYDLLENSVFYVNDISQIGAIRALAPAAKILPGLRNPSELDTEIDTYHPYALDVSWKDLSESLIRRAHAKGVKIFSDGFGSDQQPESYAKAIRAGIDVISTNKISVICDALKRVSSENP